MQAVALQVAYGPAGVRRLVGCFENVEFGDLERVNKRFDLFCGLLFLSGGRSKKANKGSRRAPEFSGDDEESLLHYGIPRKCASIGRYESLIIPLEISSRVKALTRSARR